MITGAASPRLSVVIPAYNEARYLAATLDALSAQSLPRGDFEVIVVDNNSSDDTAEVAARLGARVVYEPRRGVCAARQTGVLCARGEIVISTDADTCPPPDWLGCIDAHFAQAPDAVLVAGPCRYADPPWWGRAYPRLLFGSVSAWFALTGRLFYLTATNTAMRRSAFPGYNLHMTQGGDELDLLRRIRRRGRVVWDGHNVVTTSARRLRYGLAYSLVVTFLAQYLLAYLMNRAFARPLLGIAPAVRSEERRPPRRLALARAGMFAGMLVVVATLWQVVRSAVHWVAARRGLMP